MKMKRMKTSKSLGQLWKGVFQQFKIVTVLALHLSSAATMKENKKAIERGIFSTISNFSLLYIINLQ